MDTGHWRTDETLADPPSYTLTLILSELMIGASNVWSIVKVHSRDCTMGIAPRAKIVPDQKQQVFHCSASQQTTVADNPPTYN